MSPQRAARVHEWHVDVDGVAVATDSEGYLADRSQWSEAFARALARTEGLELTPPHWEVIRFLRDYYHEHRVQPQVRVMIRHFTELWGPSAAATTTCTRCSRSAGRRSRATAWPACCAAKVNTDTAMTRSADTSKGMVHLVDRRKRNRCSELSDARTAVHHS